MFSKKILLLVVLIAFQFSAYSQCAMCKAVLETDLESGGSIAKGINNGILYLLIFPYLLVLTVGYFIYRHRKKNKLAKQN
ncbi:MAG: hypothetical protein COX70_09865 [Flavobacteriales bacterium CG_4_10_14_0_2_um_filter_32_8]|nr:MAG: hypothetical protein COX70_09865 [Flavobacteriales bacterium CG_4_10_14_0_2_um_filter_32_8]PJB14708.1 MAG: hypothetical protein CO118_07210 [Flavobacteriales bacterium CG_4_9_14_3_um_filter_32_8]